MPTASVQGHVVARSDETVVVEGNHYFPPDSVDASLLRESDTSTRCPWKGTARYRDLVVGDLELADAVWTYPEPLEAAAGIAGHVAFDRRVQVAD